MNKRNILKGLLLGLMATAAAACTDPAEEQGYYGGLRPGEVAMQWVGPNMGIQHVKARGTDAKTAQEQEIHNVHVFIFDQQGNYLKAQGNDAFQGYHYIDNGRNWVINSEMFANQTAAAQAIVVAVANVPQDAFGAIQAGGNPLEITKLSDFEGYVWNLPAFTANLPEGGLPMIGRVEANLSPDAPADEKVVLVQMQSLMARIDLRFTMDPYQSSDDGQNPSLRIDQVRVGNFPLGATIEPQLDPTIEPSTAAATETSGVTLLTEQQEVAVPDFTGHYLREGAPQELTLYMFEHARAAKSLQDVFGKDSYPDNITEEEKQRYKNKLARGEAAYIELEGIYTNHNNYKYAVTYRLYPGKNAVDDFTIRHNRQYIHNITITGITVNNEGKEALLDTRVDIDTEANPYFIEMLRELEHDAHFNVTPMDVFIYRPGSVEVEILDADGGPAPDWIRMEPMRQSPTAEGAVAATNAGDGKREYFTTTLMDELRNAENSTSCTVTTPPGSSDTYEERIYFYMDENVPTDNSQARVPAREAQLRITYTEANPPAPGEAPRTYTRYATIRQAGMWRVQMPAAGYNEGNYGSYYFYIEEYEEYLEHYDGKDHYDHTYPGLEWGFTGVVTGLGGMHDYMPYGWRNTMQIMEKFREQTRQGGIYAGQPDDITLNGRPRGAAEYCYNKNIRNEQGQVVTCHWFLPTIREMENIMNTHYGRFDGVFQGNWYWSSNPGPGKDDGKNQGGSDASWSGESHTYARATKVLDINATDKYATSEANKPFGKVDYDNGILGRWDTWLNPRETGIYIFDDRNYANLPSIEEDPVNGRQGGFARRTEVLRIRAAYIVESPNNRVAPLDNY